MEYVRKVDFAAIDSSGKDERLIQILFDHTSGAKNCTINCIKTPPGGDSPEGRHIHDVDQIFYILSGTMSIEIDGGQYECSPGTLVITPAGVPHRNWNCGSEPMVHLAFKTPMPNPANPFGKPV
jgi:mannose-6-phosphate isomerase-like protein (cupin superfamily)